MTDRAERDESSAWPLEGVEVTRSAVEALAAGLLGGPVTVDLIRHGTNLVFGVDGRDVILRVSPAAWRDEIAANLDVVHGLSEAGAPVVAPLDPALAADDEIVVTAWQRGEPVGAEATDDFAAALRQLHGFAPDASLEPVEVRQRFEQRLAAVPHDLPDWIHDALVEHTSEAITALEKAHTPTPVLLHGDAHLGNLVRTPDGFRLVDLDDLCTGPREFDLAPAAVSYERFHRDPERWAAFRAAYGTAADWQVVQSLTVVRETTMNTWLAGLWPTGDAPRRELEHRVRTWSTPWEEHQPWTAI